MIKKKLKRLRLGISSYKLTRFDQVPMKFGILPVRLVSDAHLRPKELFPQTMPSQFMFLYLSLWIFFGKFSIEKSSRHLVLTLSEGSVI